MEKFITKLSNNIDVVFKQNINTPRVALYLNMSLGDEDIKAGVYSLMTRLFMQGTKTRTAQQLSEELDKYAIEFAAELKSDYLKFKFIALNEDFDKAMEIFEDIIKNTTFEDFDKEKAKLEGEIIAELDSPRAKVIDSYYKNIYKNHRYGNTNTVILENLKNITKNDVIEAYHSILNNSKKVIAFVGDLNFEHIKQNLEDKFGDLPKSCESIQKLKVSEISSKEQIETVQQNINQAHILRGWLVESADSDDYPALSLLNVILGASGLSSRLFLELRDKKGLAYVVRSSYEIAKSAANFSIYIATEPNNIETSLKGFEEEIEKIKTIPVSDEELENAKNNLFGKWAFITETNSQQANAIAHYGVIGLGFDFLETAKNKIKSVTSQDVLNCANKYFNEKSVTAIIKP